MSKEQQKGLEILRSKSALGALPNAALTELVERAHHVRYAKGEAIYQRGDVGDSLMVVLAGRIKISNVAHSAREIVLNFLTEGDLNGELGVFDGRARSADASALEATEALVIYRRDLMPVLERHPAVLLEIIAGLSGKVRMMSAMVEHGLLQMAGKAATGLLRLADQHGRKVKDGVLVDLKISQRDLGNYVGLSRENTSRELGRLRDKGLIRIDGAQITILDWDGLQSQAEAENA